MRPPSYDQLRVFLVAARRQSFTAAAETLNLSKGAISYQIARLEQDLGVALFDRRGRGVSLTEKGQRLRDAAEAAFGDLERAIAALREDRRTRIAIGMSTYFASRWLSPRLMTFIAAHPEIGLRLQPVAGPIDLGAERLDMAIRWGGGEWRDVEIERLALAPAFPTAGAGVAERIARGGLEAALPSLPLLHDRDGSAAWADWLDAVGISWRPASDDLVIPDPNVRVQAVIDGQGLALNDRLVAAELASGALRRVSAVALEAYGYFLAYPPGALDTPALRAFRDWILAEAASTRFAAP